MKEVFVFVCELLSECVCATVKRVIYWTNCAQYFLVKCNFLLLLSVFVIVIGRSLFFKNNCWENKKRILKMPARSLGNCDQLFYIFDKFWHLKGTNSLQWFHHEISCTSPQVCVRVYQYFVGHVVTAVWVWPCMAACGRPLVGHSDWINSHEKHAGGGLGRLQLRPSPRQAKNVQYSYHSNYIGHEICSHSVPGVVRGLWCHTPAEGWMENLTRTPDQGSGRAWWNRLCFCAPTSDPPRSRWTRSVQFVKDQEVKTGEVCAVCVAETTRHIL